VALLNSPFPLLLLTSSFLSIYLCLSLLSLTLLFYLILIFPLDALQKQLPTLQSDVTIYPDLQNANLFTPLHLLTSGSRRSLLPVHPLVFLPDINFLSVIVRRLLFLLLPLSVSVAAGVVRRFSPRLPRQNLHAPL